MPTLPIMQKSSLVRQFCTAHFCATNVHSTLRYLSLSRFPMISLMNFLSEIHAKEVDLFHHQQSVDITTRAGNALFGMMGLC
jgi:hypothetical protein